MKCTEARDAMLVADVAELGAPGLMTPLAEHLAECDRCREMAASIVSQTLGLASLTDARRRAGRGSARARRIAMVASLPVAAAAMVAIALSAHRAGRAAAHRVAGAPPVAREVSVDVARGQQAAVLKTADSTVTVIWLTPGEGQ